MLTRYGRLGASSRLRSIQYVPLLYEKGIECTVSPLFDDKSLQARYARGRYRLIDMLFSYLGRFFLIFGLRKYDVIWVEKEVFPWFPTFLDRFFLSGCKYVLDYDDATFHKYDRNRIGLVRMLLGRKLDILMSESSGSVVGNEYLYSRVRDAGGCLINVVPTSVDIERYDVKCLKNNKLTIVWIGSPSTASYLESLFPVLAELNQIIPFRMKVIGARCEFPNLEIECCQWSEEFEVDLLADADIGIMPLKDGLWEKGKCAYKIIQYMALGIPAVASPVGANNVVIENGVNGFLAGSAEEWKEALQRLLVDKQLRLRMGEAAKENVVNNYSIQRNQSYIEGLLNGLSQEA